MNSCDILVIGAGAAGPSEKDADLPVKRVVMFAGQRYREFLVDPIHRLGIEIVVPMANMPRGSQLAWLCASE